MSRLLGALIVCSAAFLLSGSSVPLSDWPVPVDTISQPVIQPLPVVIEPVEPARPEPLRPPTAQQAMQSGVLMVVSIPAQRIFVFKDGAEWGSAPVSTGRRGHPTPVGVFPILQKSVAHRSTLYNDAPMPYMQRLTWGGVALHGGNVTRARASHGCIRLPHAFAKRLYGITSYRSTAVLITRSSVASPATALALVSGGSTPVRSPRVELAAREDPPAAAPTAGRVQTIQLAAAASPENAAALWDQLIQRRPELGQLDHQIIPATVRSLQVYRLRASGAGAAALCNRLAGSGVACFNVS